MKYNLSEEQREVVNMLKYGQSMGVFPMLSGKCTGKTFMMAVAVSELAEEQGGLSFYHAETGERYHVPAGTPWQEALPVNIKDSRVSRQDEETGLGGNGT